MNKFIIGIAISVVGLSGCGSHKFDAPACPDLAKGGKAASQQIVWDDGYSTYLRFSNGMEVPQVNVLREDGTERVVNKTFNPDTGILMVHGIYPTLVLRDNKNVSCIRNMGYDPQAPRIRNSLKQVAGVVW